jgi:SAM-dependent methyltransferase
MDSMQHIHCNLCGMDEASLVATQNGYKIVKCVGCGLVYVNPRPLPDVLVNLYNDYHSRDGKNELTWSRLMGKVFQEVSVLINTKYPKRGAILDVGCGYGRFVEMMGTCGWSARGIEPSETPCAHARAKGLDVERTVVEDAEFLDNSFDAVTAFYVLEHLFDPMSALGRIFQFLKPGGMLVLRVPHTTPLVKMLALMGIKNNLYDPPFHLYDFSPETARRMLEKAGFEGIVVMPGHPTLPPRRSERAAALISGAAARLLFFLSAGKLLLPGVSKTIIAVKPSVYGPFGHA